MGEVIKDNGSYKYSFLLGVFSIDRAIHPHSGLQVVQPAVHTDAVGNGCQGSSAEMCRARGDGVTDQTNHTDTDRIPFQTQLSQNILSVFETCVWAEPETQTCKKILEGNKDSYFF